MLGTFLESVKVQENDRPVAKHSYCVNAAGFGTKSISSDIFLSVYDIYTCTILCDNLQLNNCVWQ